MPSNSDLKTEVKPLNKLHIATRRMLVNLLVKKNLSVWSFLIETEYQAYQKNAARGQMSSDSDKQHVGLCEWLVLLSKQYNHDNEINPNLLTAYEKRLSDYQAKCTDLKKWQRALFIPKKKKHTSMDFHEKTSAIKWNGYLENLLSLDQFMKFSTMRLFLILLSVFTVSQDKRSWITVLMLTFVVLMSPFILVLNIINLCTVVPMMQLCRQFGLAWKRWFLRMAERKLQVALYQEWEQHEQLAARFPDRLYNKRLVIDKGVVAILNGIKSKHETIIESERDRKKEIPQDYENYVNFGLQMEKRLITQCLEHVLPFQLVSKRSEADRKTIKAYRRQIEGSIDDARLISDVDKNNQFMPFRWVMSDLAYLSQELSVLVLSMVRCFAWFGFAAFLLFGELFEHHASSFSLSHNLFKTLFIKLCDLLGFNAMWIPDKWILVICLAVVLTAMALVFATTTFLLNHVDSRLNSPLVDNSEFELPAYAKLELLIGLYDLYKMEFDNQRLAYQRKVTENGFDAAWQKLCLVSQNTRGIDAYEPKEHFKTVFKQQLLYAEDCFIRSVDDFKSDQPVEQKTFLSALEKIPELTLEEFSTSSRCPALLRR